MRFREGRDGERFTDALIGNRGIAREENDRVRQTMHEAENAHAEAISLSGTCTICGFSLTSSKSKAV